MRANVGITTPGICAFAILILIPLSLRAENVKEYYQDKAGGLRQVELTEIKLANLPKPSYELGDEQSYGNYRVCTFYNSEEGKGYFEILHNGKRVYKRKGVKFRIGLIYDDDGFRELKDLGYNISNVPIAMGKDITGRGIPNLVVSEWTGGAHCCFHFYVFEIGSRFRKIAMLDAGHGDVAHFEDIQGDGRLEFVAADWTFAYWHAGFAQSPAPKVILAFRKGVYVLADDLMRKPRPTRNEIEDKIKETQGEESWKEGRPPPALWSYMLDLIYTGNAPVAWQFFESAWLPNVPGKMKFLQDFRSQLTTSPYWKHIKKMNE
jgi:hypothetical protein